jgi:hypothetical protein
VTGAGINSVSVTGTDSNFGTDIGTTNFTVTGYNLAAANTITTPVTLTNVHVGGTFGTSALSLTNTAASGSYTEGLDASFSGTTGAASDNSGSITRLTGGSSNSSSLTVGLGGSSNTGTAGAKSGTVTVALTSDGTGTSGLGLTSLSSQTISVTGAVYNLAAANTITTPVTLTNVHVGGTFGTSALNLTNTAASVCYT